MNLLIDGVTILIIVVFTASAYKKGFLTSIINLIGSVVALIFSSVVSKPIATGIYNTYISNKVLESVKTIVGDMGQPGIDAFAASLEGALKELPSVISTAISQQILDGVEGWYNAFSMMSADAFAIEITGKLISPTAIALLRGVSFCIIFALSMVVIKLAAGLLRGVNFIPIVGGLNEILGAGIGFIQGCIFIFVAAIIVWIAVTTNTGPTTIITEDTISETIVFKHFYTAGNLFDNIVKGM